MSTPSTFRELAEKSTQEAASSRRAFRGLTIACLCCSILESTVAAFTPWPFSLFFVVWSLIFLWMARDSYNKGVYWEQTFLKHRQESLDLAKEFES